jgi:hypothetical protein
MPGSSRCRLTVLALLCVLGAAACGREADPPAVPAPAAAVPAEIAWFAGSVEEALATASRERRPVFLYWGAVWCPPCHYLKTKLFPRPEFVARMQAFVPVYLDGDSPRAQTWGEKLGVAGYPTVIVLDPDGRELTRLPSMLPVEDYAEVLDRAVSMTRPLAELVAEVEARGPGAMAAADLNLLAFHAWEQSPLELDEAASAALFARLWRETPAALSAERHRFLARYLSALAATDPPPTLAPVDRQTLATALLDLLAEPAARRINLDLVVLEAAAVVRLLAPEAGAERSTLAGAWTAAARALEDDPLLTTDDRLSAASALIALAELEAEGRQAQEGAATWDPALVEHVRARVAWANQQVTDEHELQAVMSSMAGLLADVGLYAEAEQLIDARIGDTLAPYYYLSVKASLRERVDDPTGAVELYRQAWESARNHAAASRREEVAAATAQGRDGGMTTFRWGSSYLRKAVKLTPEAGERIATDTATILGDLLASADPFAGGNWSRLQGLEKSLVEWNQDGRNAATLAAARTQVQAACAGLPDQGAESPAARCRQFLAAAG